MSVLFYRRPDYLKKATGPINATECQRYVERAKNAERAIPPGLSFDEVINNKALPPEPCSLNDFMDYLVYVEYNAENLQFLLWYRDYVRRFEALSVKEKALSPEWVPDVKDTPNLVDDPEKEERRRKRRETVDPREEYDTKGVIVFSDDTDVPGSPPKRHASILGRATPSIAPSTVVPSAAEATIQAGLKWQPFTIQPMRDEINRVMRHYIAFTAPRELNLSHKDRAQCLHALQHTTHPSALAPAAKIAETTLRGQSHPNFIRWSICNGNKPRVFFVRSMGVSNIAFGFLIAVLLTLSRASRWWRILAAVEWFIGITTMVAAYKGLCVILHHTHARNLRPWEQDIDSEMGDSRRNSFASTVNRTLQMANRTGDFDESKETTNFRNSYLQPFGPRNSYFESQNWVEKYQKKPILRKVFEKSVWTQDETLRILQDKIVLGANLWSLIITIPLTIIFVALPKGNFY